MKLLLVIIVLLVMKWFRFEVRKVMYLVMFLGLVVCWMGMSGSCFVS